MTPAHAVQFEKGKPVSLDCEGVHYLCIPQDLFDRVTKDFDGVAKNAAESSRRTAFANGYLFALERLGLKHFGELSEIDSYPFEPPVERKTVRIGSQDYYEDEVLARLRALPTQRSIWRN